MTRYQAYQGHQVEGAGPLGLVLLTYEALYKSLAGALHAIQSRDLAREADCTSRAMEALIELSSSLDYEAGGKIARDLGGLYIYMMNRLTDNLCSGSTEAIEEVMQLVQTLREGWQELEASQGRSDASGAGAVPARQTGERSYASA